MAMFRIFSAFALTAVIVAAESDERMLQGGVGFFSSLLGLVGVGNSEGQESQEQEQSLPLPNIQLPPDVQITLPVSSPNVQAPVANHLYNVIVSRAYTARSHSEAVNACIRVKELAGDKTVADGPELVLGDCDDYFATGVVTGGWRLDENDLFRSQLDDQYCMQAGSGNTPREGNVLRLAHCDATLDSQKFLYFPDVGIQPAVNQKLCVVWKGQSAEVGDDPIILNRCQWVRDRRQWEYGTV